MKILFLPVIALMNRLNYPLKMLLILILFVLPTGTVMVLLSKQIETNVVFSETERQGVEYMTPLRNILEHMFKHSDLVAESLKGEEDPALQKAFTQMQKQLDIDIQALDAVDQKLGAALKTTGSWVALKKKISKLKVDVLMRSPEKNMHEHDVIMGDLRDLIILVADNSNLTLDPDIDSYYTMDTLTTKLPALIKVLTQSEASVAQAIETGKLTTDNYAALAVSNSQVGSLMASIDINTKKLADKNPQAGQKINKEYMALSVAYKKFSEMIHKKLVDTPEITLDMKAYKAADKEVGEAIFKLHDALTPVLDKILADRIAGFKSNALVAEASVAVALALVVYIFFGFYFSVTNATTALKQAVERISTGDFTTRVKIESRDELAPVAAGLDNMAQQVGTLLAKSEDENNRNQESILRLLNEVADLADGDLTRKPVVTQGVTGAIADSLGYAIETLRTLVGAINATAGQVATEVASTEKRALQLTAASNRQAQEINTAGTAVTEMAKSIEQVSQNAVESSAVAKKSVDIAKKGAETVQGTIQGMETIREQIQETSKRIKRLGESSQEIGEIVGLIHGVAYQTNILALNAAIQAAMAGEAGRGFSVVADEVQRLSKRVSNSTKQIETLVKTIQTDASEAVVSMEKSTSGVVSGTRLAQDAGKALAEIEMVSVKLDELIDGISNASRQQSNTAGKVSNLMETIQDITTQTSQGTLKTASSIGQLSRIADELKKTVAGFKLPA